MDLTDEQKSTIAGWISEGASLNDIQQKLKDELEINITYLETRFLLADLNLEIQEEEDVSDDEDDEKEAAADAVPDSGAPDQPEAATDLGDELPGGSGKVSVSADQVMQPGTIASGTVTFSDAMKARWYLDQMGRLGLDPDEEGYRPNEEDLTEFQMQLQNVLR